MDKSGLTTKQILKKDFQFQFQESLWNFVVFLQNLIMFPGVQLQTDSVTFPAAQWTLHFPLK